MRNRASPYALKTTTKTPISNETKPPMKTLMAHLRQRLQQGNGAYLDLIRLAYFAKGCHVINIGQADAVVQHSRVQFGLPSVPWNMAYEPDMRPAAQEGKEHPESCEKE
jgi:hypothetical protein